MISYSLLGSKELMLLIMHQDASTFYLKLKRKNKQLLKKKEREKLSIHKSPSLSLELSC